MIICDTNVWYDLSAEIVTKYSLHKRLICTHTTLIELNDTHKNYSNPDQVKKAIRNIGEFGIIRPPNVWDYSLSQFTDIRSNGQSAKILWEGLSKLLSINYEFDNAKKEYLKNYLDIRDRGLVGSIDHMNELAATIKIKNKGISRDLRDYSQHTKHYFANLIIQYYQTEIKNPNPIGISLNHPNWTNIELFTNVWSEFNKDLDFHPNQKIHKNDWGDVVNMIYVGKNEQYWTMENKWIRYIKQGKNTSRYLFDLDLNNVSPSGQSFQLRPKMT